MMTLRRLGLSLAVAVALCGAVPAVGQAATIELGTYNALAQAPDFCNGAEPCLFVTVTFDPQTSDAAYLNASVAGFTIEYFDGAVSLGTETSAETLNAVTPSFLFLNPIPSPASLARLIAPALHFTSGGKAGAFVTTQLDLPDGTGVIYFREREGTVPEPTSMALLGLAALGLARRASRH